MKILGIESSCDDTGVAVFDKFTGLLFNKKFNQNKMHAKFGGVVPELAARLHLNNTLRLLNDLLYKSKITFKELTAIAYTAGPGLINCLLVGAHIAYSIGYINKLPIIPVNHLEAHLLTPFLKKNITSKKKIYPFIGLIISGGNTQLISALDINNYKILGKNIDDPIGEVFDKIAILLELPYPGGPNLSKIALLGKKKYKFPIPMLNDNTLNFSFSGLKTAVLNFIKNNILHIKNNLQIKANIAKSFECAVIDLLSMKCQKAIHLTNIKKIIISGGVSANLTLRNKLKIFLKNSICLFPPKSLCSDNGAMIAYTGLIKYIYMIKKNNISYFNKILVNPDLNINEIIT